MSFGFKLKLDGSVVVVVFLPEVDLSTLVILVVTVAVVIRSGFLSLSLPMELTKKTIQRSTCLPYLYLTLQN